MRRTLLAIASVAVLACRGDRPARTRPPLDAATASPGAGTGAGPVTRVLDDAPVPAAPRPPMPRRVSDELIETGRGPRRVLRYRLEPLAQTVTATARITSHGFDGAWSDPVTLAPVREGFEVQPATGGGPIEVRGLVAERDEAGQPAAAIAAADAYLGRWRALLERRRAQVGFDDRGQLGDVTLLDDPAGATDPDSKDELAQRWLGLAVPLPEAAVGVGARWKVVTMLRTGGAALSQTALYRLTAIEGDRWTIEVELTRLGRPQDIVVPGLPRGATAELIALVRKVTGTVTVSPTRPLPIAGELTAEVRTHARFAAPGAPARDQYSEDRATISLNGDRLRGPIPPTSPRK